MPSVPKKARKQAKKARKQADKAKAAVPFSAADLQNITKANPYIQRLIEDAELRENIRTAVDSAKSAYERLTNGKTPYRTVLEDKKFQADVRQAAEAAREATMSFTESPKKVAAKRKTGGFGRRLLVLVVGAGAALALSESLRSKVLDTLFGAEEEFQYTPPAATPAPPPSTPVTAA
ncbi:MAG: hypothetical protein QOF83_2827 [Solirubrobacteraceae bacterium]|jgi:uncharacterized protein (UPF0147 family)|nr:hypothetical protein [Solirubrobacteraceae bacterium]